MQKYCRSNIRMIGEIKYMTIDEAKKHIGKNVIYTNYEDSENVEICKIIKVTSNLVELENINNRTGLFKPGKKFVFPNEISILL